MKIVKKLPWILPILLVFALILSTSQINLTKNLDLGNQKFFQEKDVGYNKVDKSSQMVSTKWVSFGISANILKVFAGNFYTPTPNYEVAALFDNGSIVFYNTSIDAGPPIASQIVYFIRDKFRFVEYYVVEYNATQGILFLYNTTNVLTVDTVINGTIISKDVDWDGWTEIILYNSTLIEIYFFNKTNYVVKKITPPDLTGETSTFVGKLEIFDFDERYDGEEFLVIIKGSTFYGAIFRVNENWLNYTIYGADTISPSFYDGYIVDLSERDVYINMFLYLYPLGLPGSANRYIYEMSYSSLNYTNNSDTARNVASDPFNLDNLDKGFRIRLKNHENGYIGILTRDTARTTYYFTYTTTGEIARLRTFSFTIDANYLILSGYFEGVMDDLLLFKSGVTEYTILPGENLVLSSTATKNFSSLSFIYSVEVYDVDKDGKTDLIFGEEGYIVFHKAPQQNIFYFDGKPTGPVIFITKCMGNNDSVYDYLTVYIDPETSLKHIYLMLADGTPPEIRKFYIYPEKPTARDSITIYVNVTDNLHISFVFASYEYLSLGETWIKQDFVLLTKSTYGEIYYITLPAPQLFDFLTEFSLHIFVAAVDIFGNMDYVYKEIQILSYINATTFHSLVDGLVKVAKVYNFIKGDIDGDTFEEVYILYKTKNATPSGIDTFIYYADYSNESTSFYNVTINTTDIGTPITMSFYKNSTGAENILLTTTLALTLYDKDLNKVFSTKFLTEINSSTVADFDADGVDEVIISFSNGTVAIYSITGGTLVREASYNTPMQFNDLMYVNNLIYGAYTNKTHTLISYIDTKTGTLTNITWLASKPSYGVNRKILGILGNNIFAALTNGTILLINRTIIDKTSVPNTLNGYPYIASWLISKNKLVLADTAGYIYLFNSSLSKTFEKRVTYGAVPVSIEFIDLDRDNVSEIAATYYEKYLNIIDINDNRDASIVMFLQSYVVGGNFDLNEGNELIMISELGVFLFHDLSKYYTLKLIPTISTTDIVQGQHIRAYVEVKDIFGDPINDSYVYVVAHRPDGATSTQTLTYVGGGLYELDLSTDGWMYGIANLSIFVEHDYYNDYSLNFSVTIRPQIIITTQDIFEVEHGSYLKIQFDLRDLYDYKVLDAYGNVSLDNFVTASIYYNSTSGRYEAIFTRDQILGLRIGEYNATIRVYHDLSIGFVEKIVKVRIFSSLSAKINVSPQNVVQGDSFTVNVSIYDEGGHYIGDAYVEVEVNKIVKSGYEVTFSTVDWRRGNYSIVVKYQHAFSIGTSVSYSYVIVYASPVIQFNYSYVDYGVDLVEVQVRDLYGELLTDVSVNISVLGHNISLSGEGIYTAEINFTALAPQTSFNVTIYVYGGSYVVERFFGPYFVDVKIGGRINVSITNSTGGYDLYQGDHIKFTIIIYDQFGNLFNVDSVYVYIGESKYFAILVANGTYEVSLSTFLWSHGLYTYSIDAVSAIFFGGSLKYDSSFLLLPIIEYKEYETNFDNATTIVKLSFIDKFDYPITDINVTSVNATPLDVVKVNVTFGELTIVLNGSKVIPGPYNLSILVVWKEESFGVEIFKNISLKVGIFSRVTLSYSVKPENATVIQGGKFIVSINISTIYNVTVDNAFVLFIWGQNIIPGTFVNGSYVAEIDTSGLLGNLYFLEVQVVHPYISGETFKKIRLFVLSKPIIFYTYTSYPNKTVLVNFTIRDLFGNLIPFGDLNITYYDYIWFKSFLNGSASILMDMRYWEVGNYKLYVNVTGPYLLSINRTITITVMSEISKNQVFVEANGLVSKGNLYPEDAIVQGDDLKINVTLYDVYSQGVSRANIKIIFAGKQYSPINKVNNRFYFVISTKNMMSGHYQVIIQITSKFLYVGGGGVLTLNKTVYIKPEIHYEISAPKQVEEGEIVNITIRLLDKYGNPLPPIENVTSIKVLVGDQEFLAEFDEKTKSYFVTFTAPNVGRTNVLQSLKIRVIIKYFEGMEIDTSPITLTVSAKPPVTNEQIQANQGYIWLMTAILTVLSVAAYIILRLYTFNEKLVSIFYKIVIFGEIALVATSLTLMFMREFGYAEFLILTAFVGLFPLYGLRVRLDQIKLFKASYRSIISEETSSVDISELNYLAIYLSGAIIIFLAFEIIGPNMIWFSRFILGGYKRLGFIHDITAITIGLYLFAARAIYWKTIKHFNDLKINKLKAINYAETLEAKMELFTRIVEDSIKALGSMTITTTIYTLYLLGTYIWGASRLPMVNLSPTTLILLLAPVTIPIAIIWLMQFIKLPKETTVERLVFLEE